MSVNVGIDGVGRNVKKMYVGVDGVARRVVSAYIGVDGVARPFLGGYYIPNINELVLDLSSGQSLYSADINSNRLMAPGKYRIEIGSSDTGFTQEVIVNEPFYMTAFCNAAQSAKDAGFGEITGIFGGRRGSDAGVMYSSPWPICSGGAFYGSVLHFIPYKGQFAVNYLYCFHATTARNGAYGGGTGGRGARLNRLGGVYVNYTGGAGLSGEGGSGGAGGTGTTDGKPGVTNGTPGQPGNGLGAGTNSNGGIAFFNGNNWVAPTRQSSTAAHIKVWYLEEI